MLTDIPGSPPRRSARGCRSARGRLRRRPGASTLRARLRAEAEESEFYERRASQEWLDALSALGIAVGLLLAALHQAGLATLTHTPSPMKFLNALVLIPVGYPADGATVPAIERKPLDEVLVWR